MEHIFDERLVLDNKTKENIIYNEHLIRYRLAADLAKGKTVLDIACGSGYGAGLLADAGAEKVIGLDRDAQAIKSAQENYGRKEIEFMAGAAEKLDWPDSYFDLAVSFETLEHLREPEKFFSELKRVLKKDGLALISTPNKEVFKQKNPYHFKEYTRTELASILKKYWAKVVILEQKNGLVSFIEGIEGQAQEPERKNFAHIGSGARPLYFLALCSDEAIGREAFANSFFSINGQALEKINNHPGKKFFDGLYRVIKKIPLINRILK